MPDGRVARLASGEVLRKTGHVPESLRSLCYSTLIAAAIVATFFGLGYRFHEQHRHVAGRLRLALSSAVAPFHGSHIEDHVLGYADFSAGGQEGCAAEASARLHTSASPEQVRAALEPARMPNLNVDRLTRTTVRVAIYRTFGENALDWSCWR